MSTTTIAAYVRQQDQLNGLGGRMFATLERESAGWQNIQSQVPDPTGPNGKEDSWGICQINLPSNPGITRAQALDVTFCVAFTVRTFKSGLARHWTEYRLLYGDK